MILYRGVSATLGGAVHAAAAAQARACGHAGQHVLAGVEAQLHHRLNGLRDIMSRQLSISCTPWIKVPANSAPHARQLFVIVAQTAAHSKNACCSSKAWWRSSRRQKTLHDDGHTTSAAAAGAKQHHEGMERHLGQLGGAEGVQLATQRGAQALEHPAGRGAAQRRTRHQQARHVGGRHLQHQSADCGYQTDTRFWGLFHSRQAVSSAPMRPVHRL